MTPARGRDRETRIVCQGAYDTLRPNWCARNRFR
jgi:hypothetical protein